MLSEQDWKSIAEAGIFHGIDPTLAGEIFQKHNARDTVYLDKQVILSPNSTEKYVGIILDGKATVNTPDPAKKTLLRFLRSGDTFGIANLFQNTPYISVIEAKGKCRVLEIPEAGIRELLERDKSFLYQYLTFLSGRIRYLNQKIGYLTAGSAERKLALYLASLGERSFRLDASISALSDLLDVGRASLYRAFDRLTEDGFLEKNGRTFTLLDPQNMLKAYN